MLFPLLFLQRANQAESNLKSHFPGSVQSFPQGHVHLEEVAIPQTHLPCPLAVQ